MIAIVAHTSRSEKAHQLMAQTRAEYMTVDDGKLGCERNHRKAWEWLAKHNKGEWSVILEDDAEPVSDFRNHLHEALAHAPGPIVSLYLGTNRPGFCQASIRSAIAEAESMTSQPSFLVSNPPALLHAVGVVIRTDIITEALEGTARVPYALHPVDTGLGMWAAANGHGICYTYPSLVDHAFGSTVIAEHHDGEPRTAERRAWCAQPRSARWDGSCVTMQLPSFPI